MQTSLLRPNLPTKRKRAFFATAALGLAVLTGCTAPAAAPQTSTRVMIEFRNPVDGAESELLAKLAAQTEASIRHIKAVSTSLHTYELNCSANDPNCDTAIERLQSEPGIASVTPDRLRHHHTAPQP
jgi:hypothetical protein